MAFSDSEKRERHRAANKRWYEENKERVQEAGRAASLKHYYKNHEESKEKQRLKYAAAPEEPKARSRDYHHANRDDRLLVISNNHMVRKFNRTLEDYERVLAAQGGHCAVCPAVPSVQRLAWDHDHFCCPGAVTCGKCVRGLLCTTCNLIVGKIELERFDPHLKYLETWHD